MSRQLAGAVLEVTNRYALLVKTGLLSKAACLEKSEAKSLFVQINFSLLSYPFFNRGSSRFYSTQKLQNL